MERKRREVVIREKKKWGQRDEERPSEVERDGVRRMRYTYCNL